MSKYEELKKLKEQLNIVIDGVENYPTDGPSVVIANHNCLMDIFYLPLSLPEQSVSLISSRLLYKKELERQQTVNRYLDAFPIEAHGGKAYSKLCLKYAVEILKNNISLNIFPEGAYVEENIVYRGRTGASRILFEGKRNGVNPNLVPVAIKVINDNLDMDSFTPSLDNRVEVSIMKPIDYEEYYEKFYTTDDDLQRNLALHYPIDLSMIGISQIIGKDYVNEYIKLRPRETMILPCGEQIPISEAIQSEYISSYEEELSKLSKKLIKTLR